MWGFGGTDWRVPALFLLKSSCKDTKNLLTPLRGSGLCTGGIPETPMEQVQIHCTGWGTAFSCLEVHLPKDSSKLKMLGSQDGAGVFLPSLFPWHVQAHAPPAFPGCQGGTLGTALGTLNPNQSGLGWLSHVHPVTADRGDKCGALLVLAREGGTFLPSPGPGPCPRVF